MSQRDEFLKMLANSLVNDAIRSKTIFWIDNVRPKPFPEFCHLLDHSPLFPYQDAFFRRINLIEPEQFLGIGRPYREIILMWGKGSGKDFLTAKIFCYYIYIFMHCAETPHRLISRLSGNKISSDMLIDLVNIAPNEALARQVFFGYIKSFLKNPLFRNLIISPPPDKFKAGTDEVTVESLGIRLITKASKASGVDGYNPLLSSMGEADEFRDMNGFANGELLHAILRSSTNTRYGTSGLNMVSSYPRIKRGFMMAMQERAKDPSGIYIFDKAPTWMVRPDFDRNSTDVKKAFADDPFLASAMYDCEPMEAEISFFENPEVIDHNVDSTLVPCTLTETYPSKIHSQSGSEMDVVQVSIVDSIRYEPNREYYMGVDAGRTGDTFAMGIVSRAKASFQTFSYICDRCIAEVTEPSIYRRVGEVLTLENEEPACSFCLARPAKFDNAFHVQRWFVPAVQNITSGDIVDFGGKQVSLPKLREELIVRIKPIREMNPKFLAEVDFMSAMAIMKTLVERLHIRSIGFDQWQTAQIQQTVFAETGTEVVEIAMSNPAQLKRARVLKMMFNRGLFSLLSDAEQQEEFKAMQLLGGRKIDHPKGGSKDVFDAIGSAVALAVCQDNIEIRAELLGEKNREEANATERVGR